MPFIVGRVKSIDKNDVGVIWFKHSKSKNQRYGYGTFVIMKAYSNVEIIEKDDVIHSFDNLTGKSKLPVSVLKFLNENEDIDWEMETKSKGKGCLMKIYKFRQDFRRKTR